jgi:hypothetical protein
VNQKEKIKNKTNITSTFCILYCVGVDVVLVLMLVFVMSSVGVRVVRWHCCIYDRIKQIEI